MNGAIVEARLDGAIDEPMLLDPREAGELGRHYARGQMIATALVDDLDRGAREGIGDQRAQLVEVSHCVTKI